MAHGVTATPRGERRGRRSGRVLIVAASASLAVTAVAIIGEGIDAGSAPGLASLVEVLAFLVLTSVTVRYAPARELPLAVALATTAVATIPLRFRGDEDLARTLIGIAAWAIVGLAAAAVGHHLRSLDERRKRSVHEAREAQRLQLARDLHDFVAHDVSEMLALAQAGHVLAADHQPDAAELFTKIEHAAQRALRSMDQTVHMLHTGEDGAGGAARPSALEDLPELARRFEDANGVHVHLDLVNVAPHELVAIPRQVSATFYRVAVEALTNVRRHSPNARTVDIRLGMPRCADGPRAIEMTVTDDGQPDGEPSETRGVSRRNGLGLPTMAARVEQLGGSLRAGPHRPAGWRIAVSVPWPHAAR